MEDLKDRRHALIPPNQEGLWLIAFMSCYAALLGAWEVGGWVALLAAVVILAITVVSLILRGRAGASASTLWFIFVVTSALVLSSSLREHYSLSFWPEGLVLTLVGSLSVGVSIAMYHRYIAPKSRGLQATQSGSHDRV